MIRLGLNLLLNGKRYIINQRRVGLITNQTGVNENLDCNVDLLSAFCCISALFSPEHGFFGNVQDGQKINSSIDKRQLISIHSLYADKRKPTQEMVDGLDMLIYDIQDVGSRFYTYISTLFLSMETASECGIDFVVLDRPNPINGTQMEGPIQDQEARGFTGYFPMPIRHGLTLGELAQLFNVELSIGADLTVVAMEGWLRDTWFEATTQRWVNPSPNMRNLIQASLYAGIGAIEGTNISVGRGTDTPFEQIGAPWIDGLALAKRMNERMLPGVGFYPVSFVPNSSKYVGERCEGVFILVLDRQLLRPVRVGLELASALQELYGSQFDLDAAARLFGSRDVLAQIKAGEDPGTIIAQWAPDEDRWRLLRAPYLLYY